MEAVTNRFQNKMYFKLEFSLKSEIDYRKEF